MSELTRDFTVAVFVMWQDQVLLHHHTKLDLWLPPGGHIEPNELPDEAAVREVLEEAGVVVQLVGEPGLDFTPEPESKEPMQLVRPLAIQLEHISPGHEHIDLIYAAIPVEPYDCHVRSPERTMAWFTRDAALKLPLTREMQAWVKRVFELFAAGYPN